VVDVKAWAEPRVAAGRLYRGQAPADDEVDKLLRITAIVEEVTSSHGLAPHLLMPLLVVAGRNEPAVRLGRITLIGEHRVDSWVAAQPPRIPDDRVDELCDALARALPAYDDDVPTVVNTRLPEPVLPRDPVQPQQVALIDVDELTGRLLAAALASPIEQWMTFLHPNQIALARRSWGGPARIRGPAGTGKTVAALHRVAYLTGTRPGRVLVTGFVKTLPQVLGNLYRQISADSADRVDFIGLNAWASRFLDSRGIVSRVDSPQVERAWRAAWNNADDRLLDLRPDEPYWRQEVDHVIKARGLREFPDYTRVERLGRKLPLQQVHKAAVWNLYADYQHRLVDAGTLDHNDVLSLAVDELSRHPIEPGYVAVVVDEVDDLNLLGLRLVRALSGDGADSLLLLGDSRQAIYPGGARLHDAGIDVTGRAVVLRDNYRNTAAVLRAAALLAPTVRSVDPDDHDATAVVTREEGRAARWYTGRSLLAHNELLVADLRETARRRGGHAGIAVLCDTRYHVDRYLGLLSEHDIPATPLTRYDGQPVDAVKVGTYKRAKGLDFAAVFMPRIPPPIDLLRYDDPVLAERMERRDRELYVAATRARDELWLGCLGWAIPR
jgi:hypothetical protein